MSESLETKAKNPNRVNGGKKAAEAAKKKRELEIMKLKEQIPKEPITKEDSIIKKLPEINYFCVSGIFVIIGGTLFYFFNNKKENKITKTPEPPKKKNEIDPFEIY